MKNEWKYVMKESGGASYMGSSGCLYSTFLRGNLHTAEMARDAMRLVFHKGEGLRHPVETEHDRITLR